MNSVFWLRLLRAMGIMRNNSMRLSVLPSIFLLVGCSTLSPQMSAVIRHCKSYLPTANYVVLETASIPSGGIWHVISRNQHVDLPPSFDEYQVAGHPNGYAHPPKIRFVLLQSQPNELVFCEVRSPACSAKLVWFKRQVGVGFDKWVLDRTNGDEQICLVE